MAFADDFSDMCPQTVVWEQVTGRDSYGKPTFAAPVSFAPPRGGRRDFKSLRVPSGPNGQGVSIISGSQIIVLAVLQVGQEDRVYIQGDDATKAPPVISVERIPDETGVEQYTEITLGKF